MQENWLVNMIDAMHMFFFCLINYKLHNKGAEELKVLILYQAQVRREWHCQIKNPLKAGIFNIYLVDDKVLRTLKNQIYNVRRNAIINGGFAFTIQKKTKANERIIFQYSYIYFNSEPSVHYFVLIYRWVGLLQHLINWDITIL